MPKPVQRLFANDGNIISIALAAGAREQIVAVSSLQRDKTVLEKKYPGQVATLKTVNDKYMTLENVIAARPDLVFAGWNYGFTESKGITPDVLSQRGIPSYLLGETCRQSDNATRGTMDPWQALTTDINNIGALTGNTSTATQAVNDIQARLAALKASPQADKKPTAFLFDSASDQIFTSGSFGGPQGIFDAAGIKNATADVKNTWTKVSWERLTTANPDVIYFVDYDEQSFADKVTMLRQNPASKDLPAVKEGRFVNLPYAMWTSGPLNIDAAEIVRKSLEHWGLAPASTVQAKLAARELGVDGNSWAQ